VGPAPRSARRGTATPSSWIRRITAPISLHDPWGQAEEGLVDHQQAWPRHEAAGDGDHLLLAARERVRELPAPLVQERKQPLDASERRLALAPGRPVMRAEQEVVADGEKRKKAAPLQHVGDPFADDAVCREPVDGAVGESHAAAPRAQQSRDGVHERRLPGAVGAEQGHDSASLTGWNVPQHRKSPYATSGRRRSGASRHTWPR
jgi:hypothetical protein